MLALWLDPLGAMELNPDSSLRPLATIVVPGEPLIFAKKNGVFRQGWAVLRVTHFKGLPMLAGCQEDFRTFQVPQILAAPSLPSDCLGCISSNRTSPSRCLGRE